MLEVGYSSKKITIISVQKLESEVFFRDGNLIEAGAMAQAVKRTLGNKKQPELSVSLPVEAVEYKIVSIRNKKAS